MARFRRRRRCLVGADGLHNVFPSDALLALRPRPRTEKCLGPPILIGGDVAQAAASVGFILERNDGALVLTLAYRIRDEEMRIPVRIETTISNFGGLRYWGACPDCGRRVRKLYVPPGGRRFSCRTCLDLTYESAQKAPRLDGLHRLTGRCLGCTLGGREGLMQKTKMIQDVGPRDRWLPDNCKPCRDGPRSLSPNASCRVWSTVAARKHWE